MVAAMSERYYLDGSLHLGPITLDGPEAHHLATVCRLRPGQEVCLFNGDGREYHARITAVARRAISLEILRVDQPERELPFPLEVAAPLPRGDRGQFLIEKLTELGTTRFVPLACQRSVVHPREGKQEKLHRHVIEASKQCGRNSLMQIETLTPWQQYVLPQNARELRILAHPYPVPASARWSWPLPASSEPAPIRIAVGPEGGFTDQEVALALEQGWQAASLGPRLLRIETAALVLAAHLIALANKY